MDLRQTTLHMIRNKEKRYREKKAARQGDL